MKPIIFTLPGNEAFATGLYKQLNSETGDFIIRPFPDGETYLRVGTEVKDKEVILLDSLVNPNVKILPLLFLANTLKEQGAQRVGLLTPYLPYMRQDKSFRSGESVTTRHFAQLLCSAFDWLITVDPHLHRFTSLDQVYTIPNRVVPSAPKLADWIDCQVKDPLIIGPDSESKQWVSEIARLAKAPYAVFSKQRLGDRQVTLEMSDVSSYLDCTPVLVDDIISTGTTMINAIELLKDKFSQKPICLGIHAVFNG
ncbi:MAG: ribose-phosphate diphosphokinase, partial [Cyclobacteriaceae bacterium]